MKGFGTLGGETPDALAGGISSASGWDRGALASTLAGPTGFGLFGLALANDNLDADAPSFMGTFAANVGVANLPKMFPTAAEFQVLGSSDATLASPHSATKLSFPSLAVGTLLARVTGHHFFVLGATLLSSKFAGDVTFTS